jgi:hypothetical protein
MPIVATLAIAGSEKSEVVNRREYRIDLCGKVGPTRGFSLKQGGQLDQRRQS